MKNLIRQSFRRLGYDIVRYKVGNDFDVPYDVDDVAREIIHKAKPFSLTSSERLLALISAVRFVVRNRIPGAIAECGVWRGGSMIAAAMTLLSEHDSTREIYLYDTFEGMSEPGNFDKRFDGISASDQLSETPKGEGVWCYSSLDEVRNNLAATGYPAGNLHFVKGKVEDTLPKNNPPQLALLRLDTDWYESTKHELRHLFALLVSGGFLIIDDYGHWQGAQKAVDEFLEASAEKYYLHRIDSTGRMIIK